MKRVYYHIVEFTVRRFSREGEVVFSEHPILATPSLPLPPDAPFDLTRVRLRGERGVCVVYTCIYILCTCLWGASGREALRRFHQCRCSKKEGRVVGYLLNVCSLNRTDSPCKSMFILPYVVGSPVGSYSCCHRACVEFCGRQNIDWSYVLS